MRGKMAWPERITLALCAMFTGFALFFALLASTGTQPQLMAWPERVLFGTVGIWIALCGYIALPVWITLRAIDLTANGPARRKARPKYTVGPVIDGRLER